MVVVQHLVHLVESRSEELASTLLERVKASEATPNYKDLPDEELRERALDIYAHLSHWLLAKDEEQVERRYLRIGAERATQAVPFSQLAWVIIMTKENLWEFMKNRPIEKRPIDLEGEIELLELLDRFFDRAIYYAAMGHEAEVCRYGA